ncbi:MAG: FHA domain-containing protein [Pelistega sp.]|nr:FHA domain-containing protein [Pelistega sp.]
MKLAIFNTHTPQDSFACELSPPGCTLGRGPDNTIILVDAMARISLIQAIIKIQQGNVSISNMGQQAIYINGEALSFTKEQPLQHDNQIRIGHYLILCDFATDSAMVTSTQADSWAGLGLGVTGGSTLNKTSHETFPQETAIHSDHQQAPLTVMPMSIDDSHHPSPQQSTPALSTTVLPMSHEDSLPSISNNPLPMHKVDNTLSDFMLATDIAQEATHAVTEPTSTTSQIAHNDTLAATASADLQEYASESHIENHEDKHDLRTVESLVETTTDLGIGQEQLVATIEPALQTSDIPTENLAIDMPRSVQDPETSEAEKNDAIPQASETVAAPFDDPFADFFSGPGVVPIGAEVDLHQINPFEMESTATRNSSNPLEQIEALGIQDTSIQGEVLSVFKQDGTEQDKQTIFTDATPTTVRQDDTSAPKKEEDLLDILHTLSFEEAMRR